nr:N-6 DNA methylase [Snodgrassella alvi]
MENKFQLFEDLLTVLKQEREIRNTEQAVEIISFMLFVHYSYLFLEARNDDRRSGSIFFGKEINAKQNLRELINRVLYYENIEALDLLESNLFYSLTFLFSKIDSQTIRILYNKILTIECLDEFYSYAEAYHSLIELMIRETGSAGEFYTPRVLADIIVRILNPENPNSIYDPACGTAGFLIESANYIKRNNKKVGYKLIGQDNSSLPCIISLVNLLINKEINFTIFNRDSLILPDNTQIKYDIIINNPPFGRINGFSNNNRYKNYGHFIEYYFLKHIMDSLADGGKAAVILPERFFKDGNTQCLKLKEELFHKFNIDCVLSIPSGAMLPYTAVKSCILFFNRNTPTKKVWVYTLNHDVRYTRFNSIKFEHFEDFLQLFTLKQSSENSWLVDINELKAPYNLLERNDRLPQYGVLSRPKINIDQLIISNQQIIDKYINIKQRIIELEKIINTNHSKYNFNKFKLDDITDLKTGTLLPKQDLLKSGNYPVFGGNGKIGYYNDFMISGEMIIIGKIGALCGNVRYFKGEAWVTSNAIIMQNIRQNEVYTPYLAKVLSISGLRGLAVGTAQQFITIGKIKNVEINLPPLEAQIELNDWLSDLEDVLEEHDLLLKKIMNDKENIKSDLLNLLLKI